MFRIFFETKSNKITFIWKLFGWEWGEPNFLRIFFETKAKKNTVTYMELVVVRGAVVVRGRRTNKASISFGRTSAGIGWCFWRVYDTICTLSR